MKRFLTVFASASLLFTGCYQTQEGRYRTGLPGSTDTIESKYERSVSEVFEAAKKALNHNGTITAENVTTHTVSSKVDSRKVWVHVEQAEPGITRILTQVRTSRGRGDIHLAAELDKQTALHLRVLPSNAAR